MIANLYIFVNITRVLKRSGIETKEPARYRQKADFGSGSVSRAHIGHIRTRAVETELFCYMYLFGLIDPAREEHPAENQQQDHKKDKSDQPYGLTIASRVHVKRSCRENKRYKSQ